jgi:hypothetical protein
MNLLTLTISKEQRDMYELALASAIREEDSLASHKRYREANREVLRERSRLFRLENKEHIKAYDKARYVRREKKMDVHIAETTYGTKCVYVLKWWTADYKQKVKKLQYTDKNKQAKYDKLIQYKLDNNLVDRVRE